MLKELWGEGVAIDDKELSDDLNSDLVRIQDADKSSEFDLWIRLGSIFGNRESLILPTKHHERSRHFEKTGLRKL